MKTSARSINPLFMALIAGVVLSLLYSSTLAARQTKFIIKQDGSGDFSSISEAVASVPSGSTLIICEGVYNEQVNIIDKTLYLEGLDRDKCIIQYDGNNYFEPPLSVAAGTISNLTVYAYADKSDGWMNRPPAVVDPQLPASSYPEYAIHIEQHYLAGKELTFENCLILSDKNHCVGLGLRRDSSVSFINCEFRAYGVGGIFFVHDADTEEYAGKCTLEFSDCTLYNYTSIYFFYTCSINPSSQVNLTFQNVQVHTVGYSNPDTYLNDNKYKGRTIEDLIALDSDELLIENGYRRNDLVFCLNEEESTRYNACVLSPVSSIDHKIPIPEGITRILNEQKPSVSQNEFPIFVDNQEIESHDGWCGCANFFLTPNSSENTFAEMNYQESISPQP